MHVPTLPAAPPALGGLPAAGVPAPAGVPAVGAVPAVGVPGAAYAGFAEAPRAVAAPVFLLDDDPDARLLLGHHLRLAGYQVVEFEGPAAYLRDVGAADPGVLVLDLRLGDAAGRVDGTDVLRMLRDRGENRPTVMISGEPEVRAIVKAVRGGAVDFLTKPVDPDELVRRVTECQRLDEARRAAAVAQGEVRRRLAKLTPRETEVLPMLVAGRAVKQIAAELGISPKTADVHRGRILQKMDCGGVVELVHAVRGVEDPA